MNKTKQTMTTAALAAATASINLPANRRNSRLITKKNIIKIFAPPPPPIFRPVGGTNNDLEETKGSKFGRLKIVALDDETDEVKMGIERHGIVAAALGLGTGQNQPGFQTPSLFSDQLQNLKLALNLARRIN